MIPITGTQIISAICRTLHAEYPKIPIYREPMDQDFEEPCFFVWCEQTQTDPIIWPKFQQTHNIEVRYYPPQRDSQHGEALNIGAELVRVLSKIVIIENNEQSLPIFATEYASRIINDALAFSVKYRTAGYFYEPPEAPMVGSLSANIRTKE